MEKMRDIVGYLYTNLANKRHIIFFNTLRYYYFIIKLLFHNISSFYKRGKVSYLGTIPFCYQKIFLTGIGHIEIGGDCIFGYKLGGGYRGSGIELQARGEKSFISIGNKVATNNNLFICSRNYVRIGNSTRIGANVTIMDHEAHSINPQKRHEIGAIGEIVIEENVWIGNNVIILKNTSIGKNSIIAAGAVVSGDFPENVILGGVPARIIKAI